MVNPVGGFGFFWVGSGWVFVLLKGRFMFSLAGFRMGLWWVEGWFRVVLGVV